MKNFGDLNELSMHLEDNPTADNYVGNILLKMNYLVSGRLVNTAKHYEQDTVIANNRLESFLNRNHFLREDNPFFRPYSYIQKQLVSSKTSLNASLSDNELYAKQVLNAVKTKTIQKLNTEYTEKKQNYEQLPTPTPEQLKELQFYTERLQYLEITCNDNLKTDENIGYLLDTFNKRYEYDNDIFGTIPEHFFLIRVKNYLDVLNDLIRKFLSYFIEIQNTISSESESVSLSVLIQLIRNTRVMSIFMTFHQWVNSILDRVEPKSEAQVLPLYDDPALKIHFRLDNDYNQYFHYRGYYDPRLLLHPSFLGNTKDRENLVDMRFVLCDTNKIVDLKTSDGRNITFDNYLNNIRMEYDRTSSHKLYLNGAEINIQSLPFSNTKEIDEDCMDAYMRLLSDRSLRLQIRSHFFTLCNGFKKKDGWHRQKTYFCTSNLIRNEKIYEERSNLDLSNLENYIIPLYDSGAQQWSLAYVRKKNRDLKEISSGAYGMTQGLYDSEVEVFLFGNPGDTTIKILHRFIFLKISQKPTYYTMNIPYTNPSYSSGVNNSTSGISMMLLADLAADNLLFDIPSNYINQPSDIESINPERCFPTLKTDYIQKYRENVCISLLLGTIPY